MVNVILIFCDHFSRNFKAIYVQQLKTFYGSSEGMSFLILQIDQRIAILKVAKKYLSPLTTRRIDSHVYKKLCWLQGFFKQGDIFLNHFVFQIA